MKYFEHADPDQPADRALRRWRMAGRHRRCDLVRLGQLGPWQLHPLVLVYALSGSLVSGPAHPQAMTIAKPPGGLL